ncbi:MAG: hypothetical protein FWE44_00560, partial [Defluviitaleaceae bacterium]|nr:hypothetical protein [Defluviitaleaceae bacterium]
MTFLFSFASTTIIVSAAIILILIATPVLDKKFAAGGRYFLWIVIIAALLFMPFASLVPRPTLEISVPIAIEQVQLSPPETIPINIPSLENPAWVGDAVPNYNVGEFQPPAENG